MAVIMPHGVLFRGGEERKMREWMIKRVYLEAVIGLPPALFYGTGIPASILIINRFGAATRKEVLFINADHEYMEGKVQNTLRSEDTEKIAYVYRNRRYFRSSLENLWEKYHQPLYSISQMQSQPLPFGASLRRRGIKKMSCESKFPSLGGVAGEA